MTAVTIEPPAPTGPAAALPDGPEAVRQLLDRHDYLADATLRRLTQEAERGG